MTTSTDDQPIEPLWLSHHYECDAHKCMVVVGRRVCRRCAFMYLGFFAGLALLLSSWGDDLQAGDIGLAIGLTVGAGIEFIQVMQGKMLYSARRVAVLMPFVGAVEAWLFVEGIRDGLSPAHLLAGTAGLAVLVIYLLTGVPRRGRG